MVPATSTTSPSDVTLRAGIDRSLRHPVMFFLTSGAAWLAVSILLAIVASMKVHYPVFMDGHAYTTYGRVFPAHINTLVYGWGCQAAFAVTLWLMARMSLQECRCAGTLVTAGHMWNCGVLLGTAGILGGYGTGMPWMEFPSFVWPVLVMSYVAIGVWSFVGLRVSGGGRTYISQWYLLAAMIWFPWVFISANVLLHCTSGHPVMAAAVNAWYKSGLLFLFFIPVAVGAAYYLAPKLTGHGIASRGLAQLGFWSLAVVAPWAGMQKLAGAPIPVFLPYVGAAATVLLAVPLATAGINILRAIFAGEGKLPQSPALYFTVMGVICLLVLSVAAIALNLPGSSLQLTQFSLSGYGFDMLAMYGCFSSIMFGAVYFIVPRVTCREWISSRLINMHFFFSAYGIVALAFGALFGGVIQGRAQEAWLQPWATVTTAVHPYAAVSTFAWCVILFSNTFFFVHLALMWLGRGRRGGGPTMLDSAEELEARGGRPRH
jgi:cytochrome c oxidase cbb3-type subunit 1